MPLPENVPTAVVDLDRPRRIALTLGAMRRFKEQTGQAITAFAKIPEDERMDQLHRFVWALLVNEDREGIAPEDVEEMIHAGNLTAVVDQFLSLLTRIVPEGAEGNGVPAPKTVKAGQRRRSQK